MSTIKQMKFFLLINLRNREGEPMIIIAYTLSTKNHAFPM